MSSTKSYHYTLTVFNLGNCTASGFAAVFVSIQKQIFLLSWMKGTGPFFSAIQFSSYNNNNNSNNNNNNKLIECI